jgi:hypothetical protein
VIIGEERPKKKILPNKTSRATAKVSTLRGHGKEKKASNKLTGQTGTRLV